MIKTLFLLFVLTLLLTSCAQQSFETFGTVQLFGEKRI